MAIEPDTSPYGSQTVTGPGWPNVDEEALAAAAATYEALAAKITGSIVPQQQGQLMKLTDALGGRRDRWPPRARQPRSSAATRPTPRTPPRSRPSCAPWRPPSSRRRCWPTPSRRRRKHECEAHRGDALPQRPGAGAEPGQDGPVAEHGQRDHQHDRAREHTRRAAEHPAARRPAGARRQRSRGQRARRPRNKPVRVPTRRCRCSANWGRWPASSRRC